MNVEYSHNNSGGSFWLGEKEWLALERAGWRVEWGGPYFCHSELSFGLVPPGKPEPCRPHTECPGHRRCNSLEEWQHGPRHPLDLGNPAMRADKDFPSLRDAVVEWESVVGMEATDDGCNCCGPPHTFITSVSGVSGADIVGVLYENAPTSLRAAAERQRPGSN